MNKDDIITRISQARTQKGISARELSTRIGKNEAYISRLESKNDSFEPSVSALLEIIHACEMTESEFFYSDMSQYKNDKKLIDLLNRVDPDIKALVIKLLEKY